MFILRLLAGIEPEQQTSREDKDRWGKLAYVANTLRQARETSEAKFRVTIDGESATVRAMVLYVVNAATNDSGVNIAASVSKVNFDDGFENDEATEYQMVQMAEELEPAQVVWNYLKNNTFHNCTVKVSFK